MHEVRGALWCMQCHHRRGDGPHILCFYDRRRRCRVHCASNRIGWMTSLLTIASNPSCANVMQRQTIKEECIAGTLSSFTLTMQWNSGTPPQQTPSPSSIRACLFCQAHEWIWINTCIWVCAASAVMLLQSNHIHVALLFFCRKVKWMNTWLIGIKFEYKPATLRWSTWNNSRWSRSHAHTQRMHARTTITIKEEVSHTHYE